MTWRPRWSAAGVLTLAQGRAVARAVRGTNRADLRELVEAACAERGTPVLAWL